MRFDERGRNGCEIVLEIFGAGMAGCYLGCLLDRSGYDYVVYEKYKNKHCPSECAFGWANYSKVKQLCKLIDVNSDDYVLARPKKAIVNGIEFKIRDVVIFDKPKFINDLRNEINVVYQVPSSFTADLIVDATGQYRALFGRNGIKTLSTVQHKVYLSELDSENIYIYGKPYGYAWAFPLGADKWHIGAGGFTEEQARALMDRLKAEYDIGYTVGNMICVCRSPIIWDYGIPFVRKHGNRYIVAIGEAGGFVSAFGEGNTLALETAKCLFDAVRDNSNLDDAVRQYEEQVKKETAWLNVQYDFVRTLNRSWFKALFKVRKVIRIANMRNLDASFWNGLKLMWRLR